MALWQHAETGEQWDDGLALKPGDEGFSRDVAAAHFGEAGFNYLGTPNWQPEAERGAPETTSLPAEEPQVNKQAQALEWVEHTIDPDGYARRKATEAIEAEFATMIEAAGELDKATMKKINAAKAARLAALEAPDALDV